MCGVHLWKIQNTDNSVFRFGGNDLHCSSVPVISGPDHICGFNQVLHIARDFIDIEETVQVNPRGNLTRHPLNLLKIRTYTADAYIVISLLNFLNESAQGRIFQNH